MTARRLGETDTGSVVGLIPAAGLATRLGSPTGSKELLPVWRPKKGGEALPVIHCLLASFETAAVEQTFIIVRSGKEDIRDTLGCVAPGGMQLEYVSVDGTPSPPFTLHAAVPRLAEATVVMGFPDILFRPPDAAARILEGLVRTGADVLLGLFPHPQVRQADVVDVESRGVVRSIRRDGQPEYAGWTWGLAAWRPRFTGFLHDFVEGVCVSDARTGALSVGDVFAAAIDSGLAVQGEIVSDVPFLDIGTPEALEEAYRRLGDS